MERPTFVYVTLIVTTPEKLWTALTDPEFTAQYWGGTRLVSDWKVGSSIDFHFRGEIVHHDTILWSEPPKVLSYTFRPLHMKELLGEPPSRVTFEIEESHSSPASQGPVVKLTITHDQFPVGSKIFPMISEGWPSILSSLKTMLETGRAIAFEW